MSKDYYEILGVDKSASKEDIKARLDLQRKRAMELAKKGELTGSWRHFMKRNGLSDLLRP